MASAIIHMCIAKKVNEILKVHEKEFLLGSIAPDISKQIGESKVDSHFLVAEGYNIPQLDKFLDKYKDTLKDNPFNLGYYCHLFADMLWFGLFINSYCGTTQDEVHYKNGETKKLTPELFMTILYNDYTNLNIKMIDKYNLDLSLFYEELPNINSEISEIPLDKLQIIVEKMGEIAEQSKERETIVLDETSIFRFIDKTSEDFINNLKEIGVL